MNKPESTDRLRSDVERAVVHVIKVLKKFRAPFLTADDVRVLLVLRWTIDKMLSDWSERKGSK